MSEQERLEDAVIDAGLAVALAALDAGEGEEFLRTACGWTQLEIDEALGRP